MKEKRESSSDFIVKLIIFLGALAAIFVAATVLFKKFNKRVNCLNDEDAFSFDDEDFLDDCDFCDEEDCENCPTAESKGEEVENIEDVVEE
ncbi:MAG: hypothetical protein IJR90_07415 [Clostridia bacterium]|nr:hypothetical protein [Clostridia bacterium]